MVLLSEEKKPEKKPHPANFARPAIENLQLVPTVSRPKFSYEVEFAGLRVVKTAKSVKSVDRQAAKKAQDGQTAEAARRIPQRQS
jgi:hypothetical protein